MKQTTEHTATCDHEWEVYFALRRNETAFVRCTRCGKRGSVPVRYGDKVYNRVTRGPFMPFPLPDSMKHKIEACQ